MNGYWTIKEFEEQLQCFFDNEDAKRISRTAIDDITVIDGIEYVKIKDALSVLSEIE